MEYIVIIFSCLVVFYCFFITKQRFHPLIFFSTLWFVLTLFSSMRLYGLYEVSQEIYFYVLIAELAFCCSFIIPASAIKLNGRTNDYDISTKYFAIDFFIVIILLINLYETVNALKMYASGFDMGAVRAAYWGYGENATNTKLSTIIHTYVTGPLILFIRPFVIVDFFWGSRNKKRFVSVLLIIITNIIISGGRFEIVYFAIQFIFSLILLSKENPEYFFKRQLSKKKTKQRIILVLAVLFFLMNFIGQARGSDDIVRTIYLSLAESLKNCDVRIASFKNENIHFWGLVSFRGILNPIFFVLKQMRIFNYPAQYLLAGSYMNTQAYVQVGDGLRTNAYVTPLFNLYIDAGIAGILLGMFIFGRIAKNSYHYFKYRRNMRDLVIYLIVINSIVQMMHNFAWADTNYTLAVLYCIILMRPITKG